MSNSIVVNATQNYSLMDNARELSPDETLPRIHFRENPVKAEEVKIVDVGLQDFLVDGKIKSSLKLENLITEKKGAIKFKNKTDGGTYYATNLRGSLVVTKQESIVQMYLNEHNTRDIFTNEPTNIPLVYPFGR